MLPISAAIVLNHIHNNNNIGVEYQSQHRQKQWISGVDLSHNLNHEVRIVIEMEFNPKTSMTVVQALVFNRL